MVKGVNKTVIEVMNTESKYFERILFVVSPDALGLGEKRRKKEAVNTLTKYEISGNTSLPLRQLEINRKNKLKKIVIMSCAAVIALLITVGLIV